MADHAFFDAWSWKDTGTFRMTPIITVPANHEFTPRFDPRFYRQVYGKVTTEGSQHLGMADWARAHPGRLYLVGDEQNLKTGDAAGLARDYCYFIDVIRGTTNHDGDFTAKFSLSFTNSAGDAWLDELIAAIKITPPCSSMPMSQWMAEWTFDEMFTWDGGFDAFRNFVTNRTAWARAHGENGAPGPPLIVGSWMLDAGNDSLDGNPAYVQRLLSAMELLANHPDVAHSRYLHFEPHPDHHHSLAYEDGTLTPEGVVYAAYQSSLSPNPFYLSDHYEKFNGQSNIHGDLQWNSVYWQPEVWINGTRYYKALGMHAPASGTGTADFGIPIGAKYFRAVFGYARQDGSNCSGTDKGSIYVNGALVWSATISGNQGSTIVDVGTIPIPSTGGGLRLEVDALGDHMCAQTTWGNAAFYGPGISISGPAGIREVGSHPWTADIIDITGGGSVEWSASFDNENSWSVVGSGSTYTRTFGPNEGPYTMILRAKLTSNGAIRTSKLSVSVRTGAT
jgi:hypothetical protein